MEYVPQRQYRRSFSEAFPLGDELEKEGINFDLLNIGEILTYTSGIAEYTVSILGRGAIATGEERPIVRIDVHSRDGELQESTAGLLFGLSLDGIGNLPVTYLPPNGGKYRSLIIEPLPNEESEEPIHQRVICRERNLPVYD